MDQMEGTAVSEWSRFNFRIEDPLPNNIRELTEVHHVVHLRISRRILEDRELRAGLIHDESKLNKTRLCVTWLSANDWSNGPKRNMYGTVCFSFDWEKIIQGRELYWVETMEYSNVAYRLLVTDRDMSESKRVVPFDPTKEKGPVRLKNGRWYWNGNFTSEFMLERDLPLAEAKGLSFVEHWDCREALTCAEKNLAMSTAAAQTLAFLLGNNIHCVDHLLLDEGALNRGAESNISNLWRALGRKEDRFGGALKKAKSTEDVLLGALALFGSGQHAEAKETVKTINSQDVFTDALTAIVRRHFRLPDWQMPE
jgi:hypothetical protein